MYQLCVSGASKGSSVEEGRTLALHAGEAIASRKHSLLTGATIGLPNYSAIGYKKAGGTMSVGISPAASKVEHVLKYRLPTKDYDTIIYSGLHYVGRDALLINSADAVVSIGGRLGTLHEFTIAMETETPLGFIEGGGGISDEIKDILRAAGRRKHDLVIFDADPSEVVRKLEALLDDKNSLYASIYRQR